jgi:ABC-type Mn2+/Zn2+ transport system permease subunit/Mn-dependent DtxR family transcriptional regulator
MSVFEVFTEIWAVRALVASSLVGIMCGALGVFIVLRNMSLIGDALSHAILPGVVVAFVIVGYSVFGFFSGAVIAGLISAVAITWLQQNVQTKNDAAIGIVFTAMFSIGVMGISRLNQSGGVHLDLKDFLFGNVLTVSDDDIVLTASIALVVILSIIVLYRYLFISTFQSVIAETMGISVRFIHYFLMLLLSFAVVASLQTVGVILVVAMLITPASTALLLSNKLREVIVLSAFIGWLSAILGMYVSIEFGTTPGPAMAVMATVLYLLAALGAPRKGVISKFMARRIQQRKVEEEDVLKNALKLHNRGTLHLQGLMDNLRMTGGRIRRHIRRLAEHDLLRKTPSGLEITVHGIERATALVRAHRLWETYLAQQVGLKAEQIHEDAEHFEHLLTEDMLDEVDRELGYPKRDPHGSVIPGKHPAVERALASLQAGETATIETRQISSEITDALWQLGLTAGRSFEVIEADQRHVRIAIDNETIDIARSLAERVNVSVKNHSSSPI